MPVRTLPVLRARMFGVCSSANRFRTWMPLVTPMPITSGEPRRPHVACPNCGYYAGRKVLKIKDE